MKRKASDRGVSFAEIGDRSAGQGSPAPSQPNDLFERDWEVFVARLNSNTGKYETQTYCCEASVR